MKKTFSLATLIGIIAAVLMLVLVILQFIPYWAYQGESTSIAAFLLRPYKFTTFTNLFKSYFGTSFKITLMFALPVVLAFVANAIGAVVCAVKSAKWTSYLLPVAGGILGLYGMLTVAAYKLSGLWIVNIILYALVLVLGVLGMILAPKKSKAPHSSV